MMERLALAVLLCVRVMSTCTALQQYSYEMSLLSETCIQVVFRYQTPIYTGGWCKITGQSDETTHGRPHYRDVVSAISTDTGSNTTMFCSESPLGAIVTSRRMQLTCATIPSSQPLSVFLSIESLPGLASPKHGVVMTWSENKYPRVGNIKATTGDLGLRCIQVDWQHSEESVLIDQFCISSADKRLPRYPASQPRSTRTGITIGIFGVDAQNTASTAEENTINYQDGYKRSISQRIGRMGMLLRRLAEF